MKIHQAKLNLLSAMRLLDDLKVNPNNTGVSENIQNILEQFSPTVIFELKSKIKKRQKKRQRLARRREEFKKIKGDLEKARLKREAEADAWLRQHQETVEKLKAEESVRLQADTVLHSVTRKKAEARRILALLPAISRLRSSRCQRDEAQGGRPNGEISATFEMALDKLRGMWDRQLQLYNAEESMLKVMLAEGSASRLGRREREVEANLHGWLLAMFGEGSLPETPWQQLLEIRKTWDQFVVPPNTPLSSKMPIGWVLPPPLERQDWKEAVFPD